MVFFNNASFSYFICSKPYFPGSQEFTGNYISRFPGFFFTGKWESLASTYKHVRSEKKFDSANRTLKGLKKLKKAIGRFVLSLN
jgi:hypothetical protein